MRARLHSTLTQKRQGGFILTLEFLLISTILGVGLIVGIVAIRDALIKHYVNQQSQEITVSDANGVALGKAVGLDEHEAPLVYYIDRSQEQNFRAVIGIRDDRFTTREPVYYTQPNCQGDPCMKPASAEAMDNRGIDGLPETGAVGYVYALQRGPTYGIGRSPDGIKGFLYREGVESCPVDVVSAATGSRYLSQKVVFDEPCESPFPLPLPVGTAPVFCSGKYGQLSNLSCPTTGPTACQKADNNGANNCDCPVGWNRPSDGNVLGACCPEGSDITDPLPGGVAGTCEGGGGLVKAVSVIDPQDATRNALESLQPPFSVNLPIDNSDDSWRYTPPEPEASGAAAAPTGTQN